MGDNISIGVLKSLATQALTELGMLGARSYSSAFRHNAAKAAVLVAFEQPFGIECESVNLETSAVPEMPVVLDDYICQMLSLFVEPLRCEQPILIEGRAGSGKMCLGKVMAFLLGSPFEQITLTQDSEVGSILGEQLPAEKAGAQGLH